MKVYGRTDIGMLRHENQDVFGVWSYASGSHLAIVCDGMGGEAGGREAAETCVAEFFSNHEYQLIPSMDTLKMTLEEADTAIRDKRDRRGYTRMGTTAVVALAEHTGVHLLWAGDSRAYLLHAGTLTCLTRDHSYVQELVERGEITKEEARTHPMRNLILRAVGVGDCVMPEDKYIPWEEGDCLLLCSDGLYGMVEEREILEILTEGHDIERTAHELICAANSHGGEDNITVLLLENTKENLTHA